MFFSIGKQVQVRPVLESARGETHAWSIMTAEGEQSIKLDSLEEGNTRLAACMPLPESLRRGDHLYIC